MGGKPLGKRRVHRLEAVGPPRRADALHMPHESPSPPRGVGRARFGVAKSGATTSWEGDAMPTFAESIEQAAGGADRSEEHTSELQSRENLVCRLLLEKKKKTDKRKSDEKELSMT